VDAELLTFYQGHGLPKLATVLRSRTDAKAVLGWFARTSGPAPDADDIEKLVVGRDYGREAVLVFAFTSDCDTATSARLTSDGPGQLNMRLNEVARRGECEAPYENLAVFAVAKGLVPAELSLGGSRTGRPDPVSPGKLVAFERLPGAAPESARTTEVSQPDQLERFLESLPGATAGRLGTNDPREEDQRRFAFFLSGCRTETAILTITERRLAAEPIGDAGAGCETPEHHVAIFTVDAAQIPPEARLD
jgi:hypothetical protein